jgi:hypothetical protein
VILLYDFLFIMSDLFTVDFHHISLLTCQAYQNSASKP